MIKLNIDEVSLRDILMDKLNEKGKKPALSGNEINSLCPNPFHQDSRKSFSFNYVKQIGKCFGGCGYVKLEKLFKWLDLSYENFIVPEDEDVLDMEEYDKPYNVFDLSSELMKNSIISMVNRKMNTEGKKKLTVYDYNVKNFPHNDESLEYLKSRGFKNPDILINEFNVGFENYVYKTEYGYLTLPCIVVPTYKNGKCVYLQRRNISKKYSKIRYINMKGVDKKKIIFGLNYCSNNDMVIICEGTLNALTWLYLGFNAVAIMGTGISNEQIEMLHGRTKILNLDIDKSGLICYNKIKNMGDSCIINFNLSKNKDANDFLKNGEENELLSMLNSVLQNN